jgi:hypothetical protein
MQPSIARCKERGPAARKYGCGAKVTIGPELHAGGETMLTTACCPWQHGTECKIRGYGQMISAVECREHAVECREMSERAPSPRVRDILIDMARGWERLALETEHSAPTSPKLVLRHQFRREL